METCSVVLTFESVNEILWCDHSNETSSAVLLHGTTCFSIFYKIKFGIFVEFLCFAFLGVKRLSKLRCVPIDYGGDVIKLILKQKDTSKHISRKTISFTLNPLFSVKWSTILHCYLYLQHPLPPQKKINK